LAFITKSRSMGIAIGSSIQIGLLAIPLVTVVGWATGHPFSLAFDPFSALVLVLSVFHTSVMIADSESNWLEGLQVRGSPGLVPTTDCGACAIWSTRPSQASYAGCDG
jgi:calcium/proton exchanger cax